MCNCDNNNKIKMCVPENMNLGYACINTELRKKGVFSSRTMRLATLEKKGVEYAKELATQNLKDLLKILKWNKENGIFFFRISSEIFPFATYTKKLNNSNESAISEHSLYSLDFADDLLKEIGDYAKSNGIRLTMHPAQFCVLSSKSEDIVNNSFSELNHHCEILDRMGLGKDSVIIIHGGGVYGNKTTALDRLEKNILNLPENTRNRLVLENCEMAYTLEDLLPLSEKIKVPIVIDYHHDSIYQSSQSIDNFHDRVFAVWNERGIKPKVHISNSVPGIEETDSKTARRKHSDYIQFIHEPLLKIKFPIDVMLECKMKEQAILRLKQ